LHTHNTTHIIQPDVRLEPRPMLVTIHTGFTVGITAKPQQQATTTITAQQLC